MSVAIRFLIVSVVVLALASAATATRKEAGAYRGAVRVTFTGSGTAHYFNKNVTAVTPKCVMVEQEDMTETFNWKYTWARIPLTRWNADAHGWYSTSLTYAGGPGRVTGGRNNPQPPGGARPPHERRQQHSHPP